MILDDDFTPLPSTCVHIFDIKMNLGDILLKQVGKVIAGIAYEVDVGTSNFKISLTLTFHLYFLCTIHVHIPKSTLEFTYKRHMCLLLVHKIPLSWIKTTYHLVYGLMVPKHLLPK